MTDLPKLGLKLGTEPERRYTINLDDETITVEEL